MYWVCFTHHGIFIASRVANSQKCSFVFCRTIECICGWLPHLLLQPRFHFVFPTKSREWPHNPMITNQNPWFFHLPQTFHPVLFAISFAGNVITLALCGASHLCELHSILLSSGHLSNIAFLHDPTSHSLAPSWFYLLPECTLKWNTIIYSFTLLSFLEYTFYESGDFAVLTAVASAWFVAPSRSAGFLAFPPQLQIYPNSAPWDLANGISPLSAGSCEVLLIRSPWEILEGQKMEGTKFLSLFFHWLHFILVSSFFPTVHHQLHRASSETPNPVRQKPSIKECPLTLRLTPL